MTDNDAEEMSLEVRTSLIPGAGMGLFTTVARQKGDWLSTYHGDVLTTREAMSATNKDYLMRLGKGIVVDASSISSCLARYINDSPLDKSKLNSKFIKEKLEYRAKVVATRNIRAGEEIYASYHAHYWREWHKRYGEQSK